ncbi:hypothetical protein [Corynebacterium pacaense]|uniref:hypothetical protein n=1 Tax=Corynebacterium pacaense TaxID=1816684 RepID=UPI00117865D7|nr:hypothetical protein [Corynebacterium pacaense]
MTTPARGSTKYDTERRILAELRRIHARIESAPEGVDNATATELSEELSVLRAFISEVDRLPKGQFIPVLDPDGRLRAEPADTRDDLGALILGVQDWFDLSRLAGNGGSMFEAGRLCSAIGLALGNPALTGRGRNMRERARALEEEQAQAALMEAEGEAAINPEVAAVDEEIAIALARTPLELTEAEVAGVQGVLEQLLSAGDVVTVQAIGFIVTDYLETRSDFGETSMSTSDANSYVSARRLLAYTLESGGAAEDAFLANTELVREVVLNWNPELLARLSPLHRAFCLRFSAAEEAVGELGVEDRISKAKDAATAYEQGGRLDLASGSLLLAGALTHRSGDNAAWFEMINGALKKAYESESFPSIARATVDLSRVYVAANRYQQAAQILIDLIKRAKTLSLGSTAEQEALASVMVELAGLYAIAGQPDEQARLLSQAHGIYTATGNLDMAARVAPGRS